MVYLLRGTIKPEEKGAVWEEEGATIAISHEDEQLRGDVCLVAVILTTGRRRGLCDKKEMLSLRVELRTSRLLNGCSNQLSYESCLCIISLTGYMNEILGKIIRT